MGGSAPKALESYDSFCDQTCSVQIRPPSQLRIPLFLTLFWSLYIVICNFILVNFVYIYVHKIINSCTYHPITAYRLINISNNSLIKQVVDNLYPRPLGVWRVRRSVFPCVKRFVKVYGGIRNCLRMEYVCASHMPTYLGCLFSNGTKRLAATKHLNVEILAPQKESYGTYRDPKSKFEEVNLFSFSVCAYKFREHLRYFTKNLRILRIYRKCEEVNSLSFLNSVYVSSIFTISWVIILVMSESIRGREDGMPSPSNKDGIYAVFSAFQSIILSRYCDLRQLVCRIKAKQGSGKIGTSSLGSRVRALKEEKGFINASICQSIPPVYLCILCIFSGPTEWKYLLEKHLVCYSGIK